MQPFCTKTLSIWFRSVVALKLRYPAYKVGEPITIVRSQIVRQRAIKFALGSEGHEVFVDILPHRDHEHFPATVRDA